MINGSRVNLGDTVYILGIGGGLPVEYVHEDGSFDVKVRGGTMHFSGDGTKNGLRQVYWHDPLLVDPPKNGILWRAFVRIVKNIWDTIKEPRVAETVVRDEDVEVTS